MGPWGGFITGLCENVEYVLTPAVIVFFIGSYLGGIFETPRGVPADLVDLIVCRVPRAQHLRRRAVVQGDAGRHAGLARGPVIFWVSAFPNIDFSRVGAEHRRPDGRVELPEGNGPCFPLGINGVLATLPFAVWLFLAIEQLPLAAEESVDPKRDMPRGIILGMLTLIVSAFMIVWLNPSVIGVGAFALGSPGEPLLDGFRAIYGDQCGQSWPSSR